MLETHREVAQQYLGNVKVDIRIHIFIYVCACICICIYRIYMYMNMYVHALRKHRPAPSARRLHITYHIYPDFYLSMQPEHTRPYNCSCLFYPQRTNICSHTSTIYSVYVPQSTKSSVIRPLAGPRSHTHTHARAHDPLSPRMSLSTSTAVPVQPRPATGMSTHSTGCVVCGHSRCVYLMF